MGLGLTASPYDGIPTSQWPDVTKQLVAEHPLDEAELVDIALGAWEDIFASTLGRRKLQIGTHLFVRPQIMGALLHEFIPAELAHRYPDEWRPEESSADKDAVYSPDDRFSFEIKTSSSRRGMPGNRSYAQKSETRRSKKSKTGYYLAVNFEKFGLKRRPEVRLIRFGWLDEADWIGQAQPTGQRADAAAALAGGKLKLLYGDL